MKKLLTFISLILIIATATLTMGCDNAETQETSTNAPETESSFTTESSAETNTEVSPEIEKKDYGDDFFLSIYSPDNPIDYHWVEESQNDAMSQSIYARQQNVYEYLGVNIVGSPAGDHLGHEQKFMNSVKNKDGSVDTLLTHAYIGISGYIQGGYLHDFNDIEQLDLSADYWNLDYMEELSIDGHNYLGYSDFNIPKAWVISFNKDMLEKYSDSLEESIYDTVRGYKWTVDKMISLANTVYIDTTANGKSVDDTFGLVGWQWIPFTCFLKSSNIDLVSENESGDYVVSVYTEATMSKTATLVEKLSALAKSDCTWFWYKNLQTPQLTITSGRTLMYFQQSFTLMDNLNYDINFGVLPYPMYDESQKDIGYCSLNWGGCMAIPSYLEDQAMVGDTLEMLSYYSEDVTITFYEKLLGKQVADIPDDKAMLDFIWNGLRSDFGLTYSHITSTLDKNLYMLPEVTSEYATQGLASLVKSYENSANKSINKFFRGLKTKN